MFDPWIEGWKLRELILKNEVRPREAAEFFLERIKRLTRGSAPLDLER
jgi:hypothetical protein